MHKAQGGDSGSFSPECLALHKEHGVVPPLEYIWKDAGCFERGLSQRVWR